MKIEEMSDEEFESFIEEKIKYYDEPYDGLGRLMEKIQDLQLQSVEDENLNPLN